MSEYVEAALVDEECRINFVTTFGIPGCSVPFVYGVAEFTEVVSFSPDTEYFKENFLQAKRNIVKKLETLAVEKNQNTGINLNFQIQNVANNGNTVLIVTGSATLCKMYAGR